MSLCLVFDYSGFTLALFLAARDVSPQRQQFLKTELESLQE